MCTLAFEVETATSAPLGLTVNAKISHPRAINSPPPLAEAMFQDLMKPSKDVVIR